MRVCFAPDSTTTGAGTALENNAGGIFQSVRFWQGWAVAATLAALFTFIANVDYPVDGHTPDYVAVIGADGAEPLWVVNADLRDGVVNIRAATATATGDEEYVLWVAGEHPQRVGVLPVNRERKPLALDKTVRALLAHGKTLGVARQAAGSDADAAPTAWLHEATIARL